MKTVTFLVVTATLTGTMLAATFLIGCSDDGAPSDPWPTDYSSVFSKFLNDPVDDLIPVSDSPPYPVSLPSVDVIQVSLGVQVNYFYIRIDYAGIIPTAPVLFPDNPPVEAQTVQNHVTNIIMNTDNNHMTGCTGGGGFDGVDVLYGVNVGYGLTGVGVLALFDCVPGSAEGFQRELNGEFGQGGPGYDYVIFRFNILDLGNLFPKGATVNVGASAEANSYDLNGFELYHHFAFDELAPATWTLPY